MVLANNPGWKVEDGPVPGLRAPVRRGGAPRAGPLPGVRADRGPDPAHPGAALRRRRPSPAGGSRSPSSTRASSPTPTSRRRATGSADSWTSTTRRHAARDLSQPGRIELARHDDVGRGLRERPALERALPRPRLRGRPRPGQGRHRATDQARRHPPRARLGGSQPPPVRHPGGERELRRRLRGLVPRTTRSPRPPIAARARACSSARPRATSASTRAIP